MAARLAGAFWHSTTLRIKDPKLSIPFYQEHFGMHLVDTLSFGSYTDYYLATPPAGTAVPTPGTPEAHASLFSVAEYQRLCLTHIHGTEADDTKYDSGNNEPKRGFGHIAFVTDDVYASCEILEAKGVGFKKRPDEGRMKGLAFALDPDSYWIEIIRRPEGTGVSGYTLNQTMIRVKDPVRTLEFYKNALGLVQMCKRDFSDFSLIFLACTQSLPAGFIAKADPEGAMDDTKRIPGAILELTHNHGTESDPAFSYHNGQTDPKGFSHLSFTVPDLTAAVASLGEIGVSVDTGSSTGYAVAADPDGYIVRFYPEGWTAPSAAGTV